MFTTFDELADHVASNNGPFVSITMDEALMIARLDLRGESRETIDGVAAALYRSFRAEEWS